MTQKNLKSNIVVKQRTAEKSALKNNNSIQNKDQKPIEIWNDLDTIPSRPEYPNNLPADNIEAALYLTNLNQ